MTYKQVRKETDPQKAQQTLAGALPPLIASLLQPAELESIRQRLLQLPEPPDRARLHRRDWLGGLGVFLLVFLSTFPVTVPFFFVQKVITAMRISNGVAVVMLLLAGVAYGRAVGRSPWGFGLGMVILGGVLVALTIVLGG